VLGDRLQKALNGKTEAFAAEGELLASISKVSRKRSLPGADKLRVVDLFCGVGGFSIGFENAGFDVILKADNNPHVAESVRANFPHSDFVHGDLSEAFTKRLIKKKVGSQKIDVLVGGPPCQGFSIYGKRRFMREGHGSDARNDLVFTFVNYAEMLDPDWVIMENVPGIESYADGAYVRSIVKRLQALGFTRVEYKVLNAADFGVPQLRRRFILIATRTNLVLPWPKPKFHSDPKSWQKKHRSIAEVITDLTHVGDDCFDNHIFPKHHLIVSERYKFIKQGEKLNPSVLPGHLRLGMKTGKEVKQYSKVAFRLHPDRPAPTMVPGHNAFPVHPTENRTLTIREVARIQTFPDHITFKGTVIERGLQVGNAFPPLLAQVIAERLRRIVINQWGEDTVTKLAKYTMLD
jgi:DNA (cytosine-5)-methyltransferase 1